MRRPMPAARLEGLCDTETGLTSAQVNERRARYGPNRIAETPSAQWRDILRETARKRLGS